MEPEMFSLLLGIWRSPLETKPVRWRITTVNLTSIWSGQVNFNLENHTNYRSQLPFDCTRYNMSLSIQPPIHKTVHMVKRAHIEGLCREKKWTIWPVMTRRASQVIDLIRNTCLIARYSLQLRFLVCLIFIASRSKTIPTFTTSTLPLSSSWRTKPASSRFDTASSNDWSTNDSTKPNTPMLST